MIVRWKRQALILRTLAFAGALIAAAGCYTVDAAGQRIFWRDDAGGSAHRGYVDFHLAADSELSDGVVVSRPGWWALQEMGLGIVPDSLLFPAAQRGQPIHSRVAVEAGIAAFELHLQPRPGITAPRRTIEVPVEEGMLTVVAVRAVTSGVIYPQNAPVSLKTIRSGGAWLTYDLEVQISPPLRLSLANDATPEVGVKADRTKGD